MEGAKKEVAAVILLLWEATPAAQTARKALTEKFDRLRQQILDVQKELSSSREQQQKIAAAAPKAVREAMTEQTLGLLERVTPGGYGSLRDENNVLDDLHSTFPFRRVVLTTEAKISPRQHFNLGLEFERFRKLELERDLRPDSGGLRLEQALEGANESESALEQGWLQYDLTEWFNSRAGAVPAPPGRFNLRHDDNLWNLPRCSLVDRGVSVLPAQAGWDEVGFGFVGKAPVGREGALDYQFSVVNGVSLDAGLETIVQTRDPQRHTLEAEAALSPSPGALANDAKGVKSLTGRLAYSPLGGHEAAGSFYWGRYTPQLLWLLTLADAASSASYEEEAAAFVL